MNIGRLFDNLNRLTSITDTPGGSQGWSYAYQYNTANQRTRVTLADGSYWQYGYDSLGQVSNGKRYWADNGPVPGQQFEYTYDSIGNRTTAKMGGDAAGGNLRTASYTPNALNQYTTRTVPTGVDILGESDPAATVTVNGQSTYRRSTYYQAVVTVNNSTAAVYQGVTVSKTGTTVSGNKFVPKTPENYTYDLDGNVTSDGRWNYTWDGEDRLVRMESLASAPVASKRLLVFAYDWQGRRIEKTVYNGSSGSYVLGGYVKMVYDGWNVLAELDSNNNLVRSYLWGLDLSGSLGGAGGVGGLLAVRTASGVAHFAAYDGNGNVVGLVDGTTGNVSAQYEYGPFGEPIRITGTMGKANPFRWSTKFTDDETELVYYGYRYFCPSTGHWTSKDPIGERGGVNSYGFVRNDPADEIDVLGLNLYAIDGTGNDRSAASNVSRFSDRYEDGTARYYGGPGNPTDGIAAIGLSHGAGSAGIVQRIAKQICQDYSNDRQIKIDIVGFSRGAAIANEVAWELEKYGCKCRTVGPARTGFATETPKVRFLGLFDTVHAFPSIWSWSWENEAIAANVQNAAHAFARDETRKMFRPSILEASDSTVLSERWFPGRHSDVGGHWSMNYQISRMTLRWMVDHAVAAGVKMNDRGLITDKEINLLNRIDGLTPGPENTDPTAWFNDKKPK